MKVWKKILIIVGIVLVLYAITVAYKYNVLTKLSNTTMDTMKMTNFYYSGENETQKIEHWQKDGIMKTNIKRKEGTGDIIMWENTNTEEKYVFWNEPQKIYQEGGQIISSYASSFTSLDNKDRILVALNPLTIIFTKNYDERDCYYITMLGTTEIIDKETKLVFSDNHNFKGDLHYKFDVVTDEDVAMPDVSDYEYRESND